MTQELSSITNLPLAIINLSADEHGKVAKCIVNYTYDPDGVAEKISYVIYIAIEDVKHLFKSSDWDKAVQALNQRSARVFHPIVIKLLPDSEYGLKKLIQVNHYKSVYVPQSIITFVKQNCTVDKVAKAINNYIETL